MEQTSSTSQDRPWYATAFDQSYLSLYAHRNQRDARRALEFLLENQIIRKGELGLDLCCGAGRHLLEMAAAGMSVVGIDLSSSLLAAASTNLQHNQLKASLVKASMDQLPFKECFHWAVNLFTSFGYFDLDKDNERVLQSLSNALLPGGRFLMDFLNEPFIRATLKSSSLEVTPTGIQVASTRSIQGDPPRVVKRMTFEHQEIIESVRLFTAGELVKMLERSGFKLLRTWGDFGDRRLGEMAPRCILLAEKI